MTLPFRNPLGGLPALPPAAPALTFLFFPHPPSPLPLRGRGRFWGFLMQGAEPLASPGLSWKRHWLTLPLWHPAGSLPGWSPDDYAFPESAGRLACFAARRPRLDLSLFPPSPQPPSRREGGIFSLFRRGYRPRHPGIKPPAALTAPTVQEPCAGNRRFAAKLTENLSHEQCRQPRRGGTGGEELRRLRWSSPPGQG